MTSLSTFHLPATMTSAVWPRRRVVAIALAAAGIVLVGVVWALAADIARDRRRDAENVVLRQAAAGAAQLAGRVDATVAAIDALLRSAAAMANDIDAAGLQRLLAAQPSLSQISIIGPDGAVRVSTLSHPPLNLADRAYFQAVRQQVEPALHIGAPIIGRVNPKRLVPLARPVTRPDGGFGGVVVASMAPERLVDWPLPELGAGSTYSLVGTDGIVRAKQVDGRVTSGELVPHDRGLLPAFQVAPSGIVRVDAAADRPSRMIAYAQAGNLPLIASVGVTIGATDPQADNTSTWLGLMALAGTLVVAGASVALLLVWRRPIRTQATDQVLAAMSHDLRTPLNAILGCAALLEDAGSTPLEPRQRALLAEIVTAGHALLAVVETAQARAGNNTPG